MKRLMTILFAIVAAATLMQADLAYGISGSAGIVGTDGTGFYAAASGTKNGEDKLAQAHANDIACNQLFFHNGSNGSTPQSRVVASGYVASAVTENVYGSYPPLTGAGAVDWWKNDKTDIRHNQNLLSNRYTEIGFGYSFFNNFGYYVLAFAKP